MTLRISSMSGKGEVNFLQLAFHSLQSKMVRRRTSFGSFVGFLSIIIGIAFDPVATFHLPELIYESLF